MSSVPFLVFLSGILLSLSGLVYHPQARPSLEQFSFRESLIAFRVRNVCFPLLVIQTLEKYHRLRRDTERFKAGKSWQDNDLVFCNTRGEHFHHAHLYTMFQQLLKRAALLSIRFHDLRHSAATILIAMGIHVIVIQESLGHNNVAHTLNIYGHVLSSMQIAAAEKWDDVFSQQAEAAD